MVNWLKLTTVNFRTVSILVGQQNLIEAHSHSVWFEQESGWRRRNKALPPTTLLLSLWLGPRVPEPSAL